MYPFRLPFIDKWYPFHVLPVSWERCNPFTCCKCTIPCGNKNVKLLQNNLKSYVARFTTTFKHVLQQIRWSGCCSLRKDQCLTEKTIRDSHTIPGSYVTCYETSLRLTRPEKRAACADFVAKRTTFRNLQQQSGAPNVNFRKISVRKTIWDLEFSEHLL